MNVVKIRLVGICSVEECREPSIIIAITEKGQVFELCEIHKEMQIHEPEEN
jgi:hypothetical protein